MTCKSTMRRLAEQNPQELVEMLWESQQVVKTLAGVLRSVEHSGGDIHMRPLCPSCRGVYLCIEERSQHYTDCKLDQALALVPEDPEPPVEEPETDLLDELEERQAITDAAPHTGFSLLRLFGFQVG